MQTAQERKRKQQELFGQGLLGRGSQQQVQVQDLDSMGPASGSTAAGPGAEFAAAQAPGEKLTTQQLMLPKACPHCGTLIDASKGEL